MVADATDGNEATKGIVMVVDDCESVLKFADKALRRHGYDVWMCENGTVALELYRERGGEVDLVILDMVMPEIGGEIVFGELKKIDAEVRVVVASAYAMDGVVAECMAAGALEFLNKPYDMHQLLEVVEKRVRNKQ